MKAKRSKKMHNYFVSYQFFSVRQNGAGSINMELRLPVRSYSDVKTITEWLNANVKDSYGEPCNCVVLNFIKLKK